MGLFSSISYVHIVKVTAFFFHLDSRSHLIMIKSSVIKLGQTSIYWYEWTLL